MEQHTLAQEQSLSTKKRLNSEPRALLTLYLQAIRSGSVGLRVPIDILGLRTSEITAATRHSQIVQKTIKPTTAAIPRVPGHNKTHDLPHEKYKLPQLNQVKKILERIVTCPVSSLTHSKKKAIPSDLTRGPTYPMMKSIRVTDIDKLKQQIHCCFEKQGAEHSKTITPTQHTLTDIGLPDEDILTFDERYKAAKTAKYLINGTAGRKGAMLIDQELAAGLMDLGKI